MSWEDKLDKLIKHVENAAPKVWEMTVNAVKTDVVTSTVQWTLGWLTAIVITYLIAWCGRNCEYQKAGDYSHSDWPPWQAPMVIVWIFVVILVCGLVDSYGDWCKIDYYAMQRLINMVN